MVVFGQKEFVLKWTIIMVLFGHKMVVFGQNVQNGCLWTTEMVLLTKWLYLDKTGCILAKRFIWVNLKWLYLA